MADGRSQAGEMNSGQNPARYVSRIASDRGEMVRDTHSAGLSEGFECSHVVRLSGRQWLLVAVVVLAVIGWGPTVWNYFETFTPGSDYRLPYELSSDYWLWRRHCRQACEQGKILVVGDSVIWGHYVPPEQTLTHYLNAGAKDSSPLQGTGPFANLGLDGTHPAALAGLLRHYGTALSGRTVVLHFNPLWLSSTKHDLQTDKEFRFNHAELVSQFAVKIPCYKASTAQRLKIVAWRSLPFANWVSHLRAVHYGGQDLQSWTLEHPYDCPVMPVTRGLPQPGGIPEPSGGTWVEKGAKKQSLSWVTLDSSLQWRFFRRAVEYLHRRGNKVFVLVGPFNEHMLNDTDATTYNQIKTQVAAWCRQNNVPCFVPEALPAAHYVDASHPIGEGYALLARQLLEQPAFQALLAKQ
jgi:hypothetical protein